MTESIRQGDRVEKIADPSAGSYAVIAAEGDWITLDVQGFETKELPAADYRLVSAEQVSRHLTTNELVNWLVENFEPTAGVWRQRDSTTLWRLTLDDLRVEPSGDVTIVCG